MFLGQCDRMDMMNTGLINWCYEIKDIYHKSLLYCVIQESKIDLD